MNNLVFNKEISVKDLMIKDWVAIKKETFKEYADTSQCKEFTEVENSDGSMTYAIKVEEIFYDVNPDFRGINSDWDGNEICGLIKESDLEAIIIDKNFLKANDFGTHDEIVYGKLITDNLVWYNTATNVLRICDANNSSYDDNAKLEIKITRVNELSRALRVLGMMDDANGLKMK